MSTATKDDEEEQEALSKKQIYLAWRRGMVLEYLTQGLSQTAIADKVGVAASTISDDVALLKKQAKERIRSHLEERLPFAFETCLTTLESNKRRAYEILDKTEDPRLKLQAIQIINDSTMKIMDLETHTGTIESAMSYSERMNNRLDSLASKEEEGDKAKANNTEVENSSDTQRSADNDGEEAAASSSSRATEEASVS